MLIRIVILYMHIYLVNKSLSEIYLQFNHSAALNAFYTQNNVDTARSGYFLIIRTTILLGYNVLMCNYFFYRH
jgi:hypothetical protein